MPPNLASRLRAAWQIVRKGSLFPFNQIPPAGMDGEKLTLAYANSPWVMRGIKKISGPISSVPLQFALDARDGEQLLADPALTEFWKTPCRGLTQSDFIEATVGWLKLEGESFWLLDDSWLLPFPQKFPPMLMARPDRMKHVVKGGELIAWEFTDADSKKHVLLPEQVLQIKCWNPYDDFRGLAEYQAAQTAAEADYLAAKFARNLMANNGDQGCYVIAKGGLPTDEQRIQITDQLRLKREQQQRGQFRPVFLTGDISIEDPKIKVPDAAFLAGRLQNRHEIFIALGVPASMADIAASYSIGSASDRFILIEETCMPLAEKIAGPIAAVSQRITGRRLVAWFDWDEHSVMQQVRRERLDSLEKLWTKGMPMKEVNEYLRLGLPEFPGWDVGYLPFSVAPVGAAELAPFKEPASSDDFSETEPAGVQTGPGEKAIGEMLSTLRRRAGDDADNGFQSQRPRREIDLWRKLMADRREIIKAYESRFNRELMKARGETLAKLAKFPGSLAHPLTHSPSQRAAAADFMFDLGTFKGGLLASLRSVAAKALHKAGQQLFDELQKDDPFTMPPAAVIQFQRARENRLSEVADDVHGEIKNQIEQGLSAGESIQTITDRVRAAFNDESRSRAKTIAMTETATAYGQGRAVAMREAGVRYKRWLTSGNDNVRPTHEAANAQIVGIDEPFIVGGEELMHPSDPNGSPGNVINCHCVSIAVEGPQEES